MSGSLGSATSRQRRLVVVGSDFTRSWGYWVDEDDEHEGGIRPAGQQRSSLSGLVIDDRAGLARLPSTSPSSRSLLTSSGRSLMSASVTRGLEPFPDRSVVPRSEARRPATPAELNALLATVRGPPPSSHLLGREGTPSNSLQYQRNQPFDSPFSNRSTSMADSSRSLASRVQTEMLARRRYAGRLTRERTFGSIGVALDQQEPR